MTRQLTLIPAYLLHARPYRESSKIVELLTASHGRISAVARGVRRRKTATMLQPFCQLQVNWSGRGELYSLNQLEAGQTAYLLRGSALPIGFYVNELLLRLCHLHAPIPNIFKRYQQLLATLNQSADPAHLRVFERDLLELLGYGLELDKDAETHQPIQAKQAYFYQREFGPIIRRHSADSLAISGASLIALREQQFDQHSLLECKRLLRFVLAPLLGDRGLKTRKVYSELAAFL